MGTTTIRHAWVLAGGLLALGLSLTGCGLMGGGTGTSNGSDVKRDQSGQATATQSAGAFSVKVGDCIQDPHNTTVTDVTVTPCGQPHDYEAYATKTMDGSGDYPGEQAATSAAKDFCKPEFEKFVGVGYDDSKLELQYFYPTDASWKNGDREIMCLVASPSGQKTTGSLKDAKK